MGDKKKKTFMFIRLVSAAGTGFFYVKRKSSKKVMEKLEFRKYDPRVNRHVLFTEQKMNGDECFFLIDGYIEHELPADQLAQAGLISSCIAGMVFNRTREMQEKRLRSYLFWPFEQYDKVTVLESEKRVWENSLEAQAIREALNPWRYQNAAARKSS